MCACMLKFVRLSQCSCRWMASLLACRSLEHLVRLRSIGLGILTLDKRLDLCVLHFNWRCWSSLIYALAFILLDSIMLPKLPEVLDASKRCSSQQPPKCARSCFQSRSEVRSELPSEVARSAEPWRYTSRWAWHTHVPWNFISSLVVVMNILVRACCTRFSLVHVSCFGPASCWRSLILMLVVIGTRFIGGVYAAVLSQRVMARLGLGDVLLVVLKRVAFYAGHHIHVTKQCLGRVVACLVSDSSGSDHYAVALCHDFLDVACR